MPSAAERIAACLAGIATGDAIGKQTETLSRDQVRHWYPRGIGGFEGQPGAIIPRYVGNKKREWRIGETTDDTERTLAVARAIVRDRAVTHVGVGREMLTCTRSVHPGVKSLWEFHQAGDPARITQQHEGCGAAIRVAPVGAFYKSDRLHELVDGAREASISTHGGSLAIAAAAAVAAAVSAAIEGASAAEVGAIAERAAARAESLWQPQATDANGPPTSHTMAWAIAEAQHGLASVARLGADAIAARWFPNRPLTIVPLALALATVMPSAEAAILLAANIGGDSDSVASIAGGILGAMHPSTINQQWLDTVERINNHQLIAMAGQLAPLRH
jgi:ADP-ribosylglycohydrolase